jgi:uncharacterized protein (TIGR04222 family)
LFDLLERGYLEIRSNKGCLSTRHQLVISPRHPPLEDLSARQRELLDLFSTPRMVAEILKLPLPPEFQSACVAYQRGLEEKGLLSELTSESSRHVYGVILFIAWIAVILTVHPALAFAIGIVWMALGHLVLGGQRLTAAGKNHLKQQQTESEGWKDRSKSARLNTHDPALVPLVAVFGTEVLLGSVYDDFANAAPGSSSAWGLSFDGDGCGSDGDGCGGCGGCGD